jgi:hypothetical protein
MRICRSAWPRRHNRTIEECTCVGSDDAKEALVLGDAIGCYRRDSPYERPIGYTLRALRPPRARN